MIQSILIPYVIQGPFVDAIRQAGLTPILPDSGNSMPREEAMEKIAHCQGLLVASAFGKVDRALLERAAQLKIIVSITAGYDAIDVDYATQRGIVVCNSPDETTEATADIAFGLMLDAMRGIARFDRRLRADTQAAWKMAAALSGTPLTGKTVGILGMGRIGRAMARRAQAARMTVLYHNRQPLSDHGGAKYVPLEELFRLSDVISIHCPLTPQTRHLVNAHTLSLMKPTAFLVNTARGAVVDEQALVDALRQGRLAGAGLDVFEFEPKITEELLSMDQVVLCPHIGTATVETRALMALDAAQRIVAFFSGNRPQNIVNPEVYAD